MTKIEWTDRTWNPTTGCNKVSAGCKNCYAEKQHFRLQHMHPAKYTKGFSAGVETQYSVVREPLKWQKPCKVFVNSMSDLFHIDIPFEFIREVYCVMLLNKKHTFQILTKRPKIMVQFYQYFDLYAEQYDMGAINALWREKKNIWVGTSCENQQTADERIPYLLQVPAAVRFLSCEPLLGAIDLSKYYLTTIPSRETEKYPFRGLMENQKTKWIDLLHWVIAGGESGSGARPMHPDWVRSLRDQCKAAGVPFFFKQWGEYRASIAGDTAGRNKWAWVCENGFVEKGVLPGAFKNETLHHELMLKVGKKKSGNMLDGKQYLEFPNSHISSLSNLAV